MITTGIFCADYFSPYKPYFRRLAAAFQQTSPVVFSWLSSGADPNKVKVVSIESPWDNDRHHPLVRKVGTRLGMPLSSASRKSTAEISRLLKEHEIDVIIAQTGFAADKICAAADQVGVPYIVHLRGADLREGMKVRGWGRRLGAICNDAAKVLVQSRYMVDQLVTLGVDRSHILILPPGATVHERVPSGEVGADNTYVFVGRLVPCKAVAVIIDAIAEAKRRGSEIQLDIVGDGPLRDQLNQQAVELGIQDRVRFLGTRDSDQVDRILDESGGLVIHTVDDPGGPEAWGNVVTEAMAAARPVITSRCGGLVDQIIDGEQGFVVEQRDANGLADAMIRLGNDPQLRAKMGKAARERAAKMFDASDLAHRVEDLAVDIAENARINRQK